MFTKISLVLIAALLIVILVNQRSQQVVQAQGSIEYKVVDVYVTPDGKSGSPATDAKCCIYLQDALDEYGKAGWQLVSHSFFESVGPGGRERLIFMRK